MCFVIGSILLRTLLPGLPSGMLDLLFKGNRNKMIREISKPIPMYNRKSLCIV
jgi:hypothetical protein